jgi:hypothetical protein
MEYFMTFVLNLLHKDFSLIAADKQGNSSGPTTFKQGGLTINTTGKLTIEGINKIVLSADKKMAMGYAGTVSDHGYLELFKKSESPVEAMRIFRTHMESYYDFDTRDLLLEGKPQMENQILLSFFDPEKSAYFTNMNFYTKLSNSTCINARRANPSPMLCHTGSGSNSFESATGIESINSFIAEVAAGADLAYQLQWFEEAFKKVSAVAQGCGSNFDAVLSTRESQEFVYVRKG